jgi:hypothetical protein
MGHIGIKGLGRAVEGLQYSDDSAEMCEVCARANIKRSPFPSRSKTRAKDILERVHSDICGPFPHAYGEFKYSLVILDEYSSFRVVYHMKKRSETPKKVITYKMAYEKMHKTKLRRI